MQLPHDALFTSGRAALLAALSLALLAAPAWAQEDASDEPARPQLEVAAPLYVLVDEDDLDARYHLERGLKQAFDEDAYPGEVIIKRFAANAAPDDAQRLIVRVFRWGATTPADFEARLSVSLRGPDLKEDLGVVVGRADGSPAIAAGSGFQTRRLFESSALSAAEKVVQRLQPYLPKVAPEAEGTPAAAAAAAPAQA